MPQIVDEDLKSLARWYCRRNQFVLVTCRACTFVYADTFGKRWSMPYEEIC